MNGGGTAAGSGGTASGAAAGQAGTSASLAGAGGGPDPTPVDQSTLPDVTLHLAGDSTVMSYEPSSAQEGWGQELGQFFIDRVHINNQAIGGASIRTFQAGRWTNILSALAAGDYVMIQFGTNDSGTVQGRHVDVPDFEAALNEMVDEVESAQATAIFVTPSALQEWSGDVAGNSRLGPYADAMREVGPLRDVLVDDLNARGIEFLNTIGQASAQEIYIGGDKAHFTKTGAIQMAQFVAEELNRIESPLGAYLAR
jgi:lysophospholipase L1-like esterase